MKENANDDMALLRLEKKKTASKKKCFFCFQTPKKSFSLPTEITINHIYMYKKK